MSEIERVLDGVARELAWLAEEPVFLGEATIGLFLDEFGRGQLRATKDVDCIVPRVTSRTAWWKLEEQLREHGWKPDPNGPICRYRSPSGAMVDMMSEDPRVLGFAGRWYPAAVAAAVRRTLETGRSIRVPAPEHMLACKLEAWQDRGRADPLVSQDLEDVVALLDGCHELEAQIQSAPQELRQWIADALHAILVDPLAAEAVVGHLPRGGDVRDREERVVARMTRLAADR